MDLFKAIIAGEFTFGDGWEEVSDEAKDLINRLLVTNPDQRYTAKDALGSKWIRANAGLLKQNSLMTWQTSEHITKISLLRKSISKEQRNIFQRKMKKQLSS